MIHICLTWLVRVLVVYLTASLGEYLPHRFLMHRRKVAMFFERHGMPGVSAYLMETFQEHVDHHTKCYDVFDHEDGPCGLKNLTIKAVTELMLAAVPALIALYFDWITCVMMLGMALVHAYLWSTFHSEMHRPKGTWFSKTWIFHFLARWHFLHHRHMKTNYNVIFVGWDWILFTAAKETAEDREAMQHEHWRVRSMRRTTKEVAALVA